MNERLRTLRISLGLSMQQFADLIGTTSGAISMMENGKRPITQSRIKSICSVFNVSENWLVNGIGEMRSQSSEDVIADIAATLFVNKDDTFRLKLIRLLAKMDTKQMEVLKSYIEELVKEESEDNGMS